MNDFLPESLPPVHYFLEELNTPGWFWFFRIVLILCLIFTGIIYYRYRKYLPRNDEKKPRVKKRR